MQAVENKANMNSNRNLKMLVIATSFPKPDQASGDLRFFTLLSLLARKHQLHFCALNPDGTVKPRSEDCARLENVGITLHKVDLLSVLKYHKPDIVWFEFFHHVRSDYLALIERNCPQAWIVVDSVDVHFNRLEAKARLSGKTVDVMAARQMKKRELEAYARADMVFAVSEDDQRIIKLALPNIPVEVVPNLHEVPPFLDLTKRQYGELVFVGGFKHEPNVDAMLYFCGEVMPIVVAARPEAKLRIIGSHPPQVIESLANAHVEVLGHVPKMAPYLENAYISVAPLRYGGGMKGKVGEAMSYGLPVVTTSFGAEGFGLQLGADLLIGDTPESFAAQVISLLDDSDLYRRVAQNGYDFIKEHYSVPVVEQRLESVIQRLTQMPQRVIPMRRRLRIVVRGWFDRNIAWRMHR